MSGEEHKGESQSREIATTPPSSRADGRDSAGRFVAGVSGNPHGKPKKPPLVKRLAERYSPRMLKVLVDIALDPKVKVSERRKAAMDVIAVRYGRPNTEGATPLNLQINNHVGGAGDRPPLPADITPAEAYLLMLRQPDNAAAFLAAIRASAEATPAPAIEHQPSEVDGILEEDGE